MRIPETLFNSQLAISQRCAVVRYRMGTYPAPMMVQRSCRGWLVELAPLVTVIFAQAV